MSKYQYPLRGEIKITCPFGKKGNWTAGWHIGVDMVGADRRIYAITEGVVQSVNAKSRSYGNHILVQHDDGMVSLYAHLSEIWVKKGDAVTPDTVLGIMGASGNATGAHLHLELHKEGYHYPPRGAAQENCHWLVNPLEWLEEKMETNAKVQEPQQIQVIKNGTPHQIWAVNIHGNYFIKLRDLERLFPLFVSFDGENPILTEKV